MLSTSAQLILLWFIISLENTEILCGIQSKSNVHCELDFPAAHLYCAGRRLGPRVLGDTRSWGRRGKCGNLFLATKHITSRSTHLSIYSCNIYVYIYVLYIQYIYIYIHICLYIYNYVILFNMLCCIYLSYDNCDPSFSLHNDIHKHTNT